MDSDRDVFGLADDEVTFIDDDGPARDLEREPHVMTVLGAIEPTALGITLPHEHLLAAPPATVWGVPDYRIDDREAALADAESFGFAGGGTIVDCTTPDNGRDLTGLAWVSSRSGVNVVATAGFHREVPSARSIVGRTPDELAAALIAELRDGDPITGVRPGQLKAGSSLGEITAGERRAFEAVAVAHLATGVPIITHAEAGTMALEQIALLGEVGVRSDRITVSHLDRRFGDGPFLRAVLATGATIGFDQLGKPRHGPDEPKAAVIASLVAEGFGRQILLSHDLARRSLRPAYGGTPGFTYLQDTFVFLLMDAGVEATDIRLLLVDNPARTLTVWPQVVTDPN